MQLSSTSRGSSSSVVQSEGKGQFVGGLDEIENCGQVKVKAPASLGSLPCLIFICCHLRGTTWTCTPGFQLSDINLDLSERGLPVLLPSAPTTVNEDDIFRKLFSHKLLVRLRQVLRLWDRHYLVLGSCKNFLDLVHIQNLEHSFCNI